MNMIALTMVFVLQHLENVTRIDPPMVPDIRFDLQNVDTELTGGLQAEQLFRFSADELLYLVDALRMPRMMYTTERDKFFAIDGLCIVLRRLVFPVRYMDMVHLFGRQTCSLSRIHRRTLVWLYQRWHHLNDFDPARVSV